MLKSISIQNFRCFRELDVELRPLTVLIGPNDSGKSSFLSCCRACLRGESFQHNDAWGDLRAKAIRIVAQTEFGPITFENGGLKGDTSPLQSIRHPQVFNLPADGVALSSLGFEEKPGVVPEILGDGREIPALVDFLLRHDRHRFDQLVSEFIQTIDDVEQMTVLTPTRDTRQIVLKIKNCADPLPPSHISVGVRAILFYLTMSYHPKPPSVIMIEEPENGVHPKRLCDIVNLLRRIVTGQHSDRPSQVILTTHSPYLLDAVDLSRDQVLVFRRNSDGSRTIEPADKERLDIFLDEFMLGEVWYNQGEDGMVAKPQ